MPDPHDKNARTRTESPAFEGSEATTQIPEPSARLGALQERYELLAELGHGGMGVVYKARDKATDEIVALKLLKPDLAARPEQIDRFKAELRLARKITHKHVCRTYELLRFGSTAVIAMEYVEGQSLRSVLDSFESVSLRKGIEWTRQICSALAEAHQQGVVHRDLKPENIVIDSKGQAKVMDFGIARSMDGTKTGPSGMVVGTPAYMSPEQAQGKPVDARSDIYSLGLMLYEMFTGKRAFQADTPVALAVKQIHETPPSPLAVEPLLLPFIDTTIRRCLEKDPERRFQSVRELVGALEWLDNDPRRRFDSPSGLGGTQARGARALAGRDGTLLSPPAEILRWRVADAALLLAAMFGIVALVWLGRLALPDAHARVRIGRADAERRAVDLLARAGWNNGVARFRSAALTDRLLPSVLAQLGDPFHEMPGLIADYQRLSWTVEVQTPELSWLVRIDSDDVVRDVRPGEVRDEAQLRRVLASAAASVPTGDDVTRDYLSELFGVDEEQLEPPESTSDSEFYGVEPRHTVWKDGSPDRFGWHRQYEVSTVGELLLSARRSSRQPPTQELSDRAASRPLYGPYWVGGLLLGLIAVVFWRGRVFERLEPRPALIALGLVAVVLPQMSHLREGFTALFQAFESAGLTLLSGLLLGWGFLTIDYFVMRHEPRRWASVRHLLAGSWGRESGVPWTFLRGTLLAAATLGGYVLVRAAGLDLGLIVYYPKLVGLALHQSVPFTAAFLVGHAVLDALIMGLLVSFIATLAGRVLRRLAVRVALGAAVWTASLNHVHPEDPITNAFEAGIVFAFASVASAVFAKYDFLTVVAFLAAFYVQVGIYAGLATFASVGRGDYWALVALWSFLLFASGFVVFRDRISLAWSRITDALE